MSSLGKSLFISMIAIGISVPALAQPKADAGSGPTTGATSTNDAGSGPTTGSKPNSGTTTSDASNSTENSAGVTPGPKSTGGSQPVTPAMPEKKQ
jgi:hypothetical protein